MICIYGDDKTWKIFWCKRDPLTKGASWQSGVFAGNTIRCSYNLTFTASSPEDVSQSGREEKWRGRKFLGTNCTIRFAPFTSEWLYLCNANGKKKPLLIPVMLRRLLERYIGILSYHTDEAWRWLLKCWIMISWHICHRQTVLCRSV